MTLKRRADGGRKLKTRTAEAANKFSIANLFHGDEVRLVANLQACQSIFKDYFFSKFGVSAKEIPHLS